MTKQELIRTRKRDFLVDYYALCVKHHMYIREQGREDFPKLVALNGAGSDYLGRAIDEYGQQFERDQRATEGHPLVG